MLEVLIYDYDAHCECEGPTFGSSDPTGSTVNHTRCLRRCPFQREIESVRTVRDTVLPCAALGEEPGR
jgi:hypothetical protein